MVDVYTVGLYIGTGILAWAGWVTGGSTARGHDRVISNLDDVHDQLTSLSRTIRSAHTDILSRRLQECQYMGNVDNSLCTIDALIADDDDSQMADSRPETAGQLPSQDTWDRKSLIEDLRRKQALLEKLSGLVDAASSNVRQERKRSCNLNLGFHCQTEHYSAVADMYNWLQSGLSPGRRRRDVSAHRDRH